MPDYRRNQNRVLYPVWYLSLVVLCGFFCGCNTIEEIEKISRPIAKATKKAIEKGYYIAPSGLKISLRKGKELFEENEEISNQLLNRHLA